MGPASVLVYDVAATLFAAASLIFILAALWRVRMWFLGSDSPVATLKGVVRTVFSFQILTVIKVAFTRILVISRLFRSGFYRGLEKTFFIIFYSIVILINHVLSVVATNSFTIPEFIKDFFYSPFFPAYLFTIEGWQQFPWLTWYFFLDNLSMVVIILCELLLIYRRFFEKYFVLTTTEDKVSIFAPVVWLIFRLIGEGASMAYFSIPAELGEYMFAAYAISLALLQLSAATIALIYNMMWLLSGLAFAIFIGMWVFTKLWHAFAGALTIIMDALEEVEERRALKAVMACE